MGNNGWKGSYHSFLKNHLSTTNSLSCSSHMWCWVMANIRSYSWTNYPLRRTTRKQKKKKKELVEGAWVAQLVK